MAVLFRGVLYLVGVRIIRREASFRFSRLVRLGLFYFACSVALLVVSWGLCWCGSCEFLHVPSMWYYVCSYFFLMGWLCMLILSILQFWHSRYYGKDF